MSESYGLGAQSLWKNEFQRPKGPPTAGVQLEVGAQFWTICHCVALYCVSCYLLSSYFGNFIFCSMPVVSSHGSKAGGALYAGVRQEGQGRGTLPLPAAINGSVASTSTSTATARSASNSLWPPSSSPCLSSSGAMHCKHCHPQLYPQCSVMTRPSRRGSD